MRRIGLCLALLSLCLPERSASAQSLPTNDPVLRRIWSIGMDSSQTYARPACVTPARKAADWVS